MIVLFFTERSGSNFYAETLAQKTGYKNLQECFNIKHYTDSMIESNLNYIKKEKDVIVKLSFIQWKDNFNILQKCLEYGDEFHFIYRKDYNAQLLSYYISMETNIWNPNDTQTINLDIDEEKLFDYHNKLITNYTKIGDVFKNCNEKKLICYEDFATPENKYVRNVNLNGVFKKFSVDTLRFFV